MIHIYTGRNNQCSCGRTFKSPRAVVLHGHAQRRIAREENTDAARG